VTLLRFTDPSHLTMRGYRCRSSIRLAAVPFPEDASPTEVADAVPVLALR